MKKIINLLCIAALFVACNQKQPTVLTIDGTVEGYNTSALYLYNVKNQHYGYIELLDTIPVTNGKFTYTNDSLQTELYFLSTEGNARSLETFTQGAYLFLQKGANDVKVSQNDKEGMQLKNESFPLQTQYVEFTKEKDIVGNKHLLDSLDQLFYAAMEVDNRAEMARIKEESMPYSDESMRKTGEWLSKKINDNKQSLFGLYLFYTYRFQNRSFSTMEEISKIRERLAGMDEEAKKSPYFDKIEKQLSLIENAAIGHEAPEIVGLDSLDNEVKLSDFRGKYVLVDFWSSTCSWCRKETPNFQKTFDAFKDKNLVILGVSSDFKKEDWLKAVHEDKSYWNQIMMRQKDIKKIMDSYVIVGIPEILLVDPQGILLAKELRGEDIYNAVAEHVK